MPAKLRKISGNKRDERLEQQKATVDLKFLNNWPGWAWAGTELVPGRGLLGRGGEQPGTAGGGRQGRVAGAVIWWRQLHGRKGLPERMRTVVSVGPDREDEGDKAATT